MTVTGIHHLRAIATTRTMLIGLSATLGISIALVTANDVAPHRPTVQTAQPTNVNDDPSIHRVTSPIPAYATTVNDDPSIHRVTSPIPAYATTPSSPAAGTRATVDGCCGLP